METVFIRILNMSITASYVIAAVMVVRLLLQKAPKKYSYLLWSVVAFRLCCPFSFQSVFSLFNLKPFDMTTAQRYGSDALQYIPNTIGTMARPNITVGIPAANEMITDSLPAATTTASVNPIQIWLSIGAIFWIMGMVVLLIYGIISYMRLRRILRNAVLIRDHIYCSDQIRSPFVLGFLRPKIYLPFGLDENRQRYVLTHEKYHIKRLDHLIKPLAYLLLSVYWFNPLCWLAFFLMNKDMEMSCDEKVLSSKGFVRKEYGTLLLSFASNRRFPSPSPLAFGENGVKMRIINILNWKKPTPFITIAGMVLCMAVLAACSANPASVRSQNLVSLDQLQNNYDLEQAKKDGCVVFENGDITSGQSTWDFYIKEIGENKSASVRLVYYYTLGDSSRYAPELYEEIKNDYPVLYVKDLTFDGVHYTIEGYEDNLLISKQYQYLMKYQGHPKSSTATFSDYLYYVLINDDTVTWEEIERGLYSSQFDAWIDHYRVYTDLTFK